MVEIKIFSKNHIDTIINEGEDGSRWRLTGFYGHLDVHEKDASWDLIRRLNGNCNMPWIICGDFNDILYSYEKKGGIPRDDHRMVNFRQVLEDCNLVDGGF